MAFQPDLIECYHVMGLIKGERLFRDVHYGRNAVHTHHIHGANHRYITSTTETTSKGHSSREIPPRSSYEGEGKWPYQEQNKEKQFHT